MSFSIGIVGLPNVGKSTLFQAITKQKVKIANYPFTTIDPNKAIVAVPDEKLIKLGKLINPEKITPAKIEIIDIAGLVEGAHQGKGMGNEFLEHIRETNAIILVYLKKPEIKIIKYELKQKNIQKPVLYLKNLKLQD
ncbi:MAG: GTPase [bacterium]